jgi:hypothetical protein
MVAPWWGYLSSYVLTTSMILIQDQPEIGQMAGMTEFSGGNRDVR